MGAVQSLLEEVLKEILALLSMQDPSVLKTQSLNQMANAQQKSGSQLLRHEQILAAGSQPFSKVGKNQMSGKSVRIAFHMKSPARTFFTRDPSINLPAPAIFYRC